MNVSRYECRRRSNRSPGWMIRSAACLLVVWAASIGNAASGPSSMAEIGPRARAISKPRIGSTHHLQRVLAIDPAAHLPSAPTDAPLEARGSSLASLDVFPNGDGVEVDRPTAIQYSADGQFVLVAAMGANAGGANLSVYDAQTLAFIRAIPLTHTPEEMAIVPGTTDVLLSNPGTEYQPNNKLTVVDYAAGTENHIIDVVPKPRGIAVSPDSSRAVVVGVDEFNGGLWGIVDLTSHTMVDSFSPPLGTNPMTLSLAWDWGAYDTELATPIFLPSGHEVAALVVNFINVDVKIIDIDTQAEVDSFVAASPAPFQSGIRATEDGSVVAVVAREGFPTPANIRLFALDTATGTTQSLIVGTSPQQPNTSPPLIRSDGSAVAVNSDSGLSIVSMATGAVTSADVSGFDHGQGWWPVCNIAGGQYFLLWARGAGALGYQIFDWDTGNRVAELVVDDLQLRDDVFTEGVAVSPTNDTQVVFFDPVNRQEDLVLLDLDPTNPQVLVRSHCGDAIEGDRAIDLKLSADENVALQTNFQSGNACFIDMNTLTRSGWTDIFAGVTDSVLTPDGSTAAFAGGRDEQEILLLDRLTSTTTSIPLPVDAIALALALDSSGQYLYTLLGYDGVPTSELVRIDLTTQSLDPVAIDISLYPPVDPLYVGTAIPSATMLAVLNEPQRWAAQSHDGTMMAVGSTDYTPDQNAITLVDKATWSAVVEIPLADIPIVMQFTADDERLYVGTLSSIEVIEIDGAGSSVLASIPQPSMTRSMALSQDESKLYLAVENTFAAPHGHIRVIDTAALQQSASLNLPLLNDFDSGFGLPDLHNVTHLRWINDGAELLAFCWNGDAHRIDPATDQVIESFTTGFVAPSDVIARSASGRGESVQFLACSAQDSNDGVALLTLGTVASCSADISGSNGVVNIDDLLELLANWGTDGPGANIADPDDVVNIFDLLGLLAAWGDC